MARAAFGMSRSVLSVAGILAGLTSTAIRTALGTNSCRSASRFAAKSFAKKLIPVRFPPGRARLATRPSLTGSSPTPKTTGICGRSFGCKRSKVAGWRGDNGDATTHQVSHEHRKAIELPIQPMVLHRYVLALDVAGFVKAVAKSGG